MPKKRPRKPKKRSRKHHQPLMPAPKSRAASAALKALAHQNTEDARKRWRAINAKTTAARGVLSQIIAQAEPDPDIDSLPIVTGLAPPRPPKPPKSQKRTVAPLGLPAVADPSFMRRMSKHPKPAKRRPASPTVSDPAPSAAPTPA